MVNPKGLKLEFLEVLDKQFSIRICFMFTFSVMLRFNYKYPTVSGRENWRNKMVMG